MRAVFVLIVFLLATVLATETDSLLKEFSVTTPDTVLNGINFTLSVTLEPYHDGQVLPDKALLIVRLGSQNGTVVGEERVVIKNGNTTEPQFVHQVPVQISDHGHSDLYVSIDYSHHYEKISVYCIPGWLAIIPPVITILMAVIFRQVYVALLTGMLFGTTFLNAYNPFIGFLRLADTYMVNAFAEKDHATIICITFLLGALIGLVQKCGGGLGLAKLVTRYATTPLRAELACFLLGSSIFFDDYCSILIVGNSMRSVMKQVHVSSENFAFIVHCVGVSVSSFCPISSWVGVQVGYISSSYNAANVEVDSFMIFLKSIQYRFFPLGILMCVFVCIVLQKHFGPMYKAASDDFKSVSRNQGYTGHFDDNDSTTGEGLAVKNDVPQRWFNAVIPFGFVVVATFLGMYLSGFYRCRAVDKETTIVNVFAATDSLGALLWASLAGCAITIVLVFAQSIFTVAESIEALMWGIKEVLEPTIVMVLAWGLGLIMADLNTGLYLSSAIGDSIEAQWLPCLVLLLTYLMCFATGSAFGTMGILFPLVVPVVLSITEDEEIRLQAVSAILGGGAFGNIASPIADDTILTSVAVQLDLHQHTKTHLPYVFMIAALTFLTGFLPLALWPAMPSWSLLLITAAVIFSIFLLFGSSPYEVESFHKPESNIPFVRWARNARKRILGSSDRKPVNINSDGVSVSECTRLLDEQHFDEMHSSSSGGHKDDIDPY